MKSMSNASPQHNATKICNSTTELNVNIQNTCEAGKYKPVAFVLKDDSKLHQNNISKTTATTATKRKLYNPNHIQYY